MWGGGEAGVGEAGGGGGGGIWSDNKGHTPSRSAEYDNRGLS